MKLNKLLLLMFGIFILLPLISAFYLGGRYYSLSPSQLLENEWVVFGGIFLLVFALVYAALKSSFGKGDESKKGAVIVISLVVALFSAAALTQETFFYGYFGETLVSWVFMAVFIAFIIMLVPLYKKLNESFSTLTSAGITFLAGWFILKFFTQQTGFNILDFFSYYGLDVISDLFYFFLGDGILIIVLIIIGAGFLIRKKRKDKRRRDY